MSSPFFHRQHLPGQPAKTLFHLTPSQKSKEADLKVIEPVTSGSVSGATEQPKPEQLKPEPAFPSEEQEKSSTETGATSEGPVKPSTALPSSGTSDEVTDVGDSSVTASESLEVKEQHPASGRLPDDDGREKWIVVSVLKSIKNAAHETWKDPAVMDLNISASSSAAPQHCSLYRYRTWWWLCCFWLPLLFLCRGVFCNRSLFFKSTTTFLNFTFLWFVKSKTLTHITVSYIVSKTHNLCCVEMPVFPQASCR